MAICAACHPVFTGQEKLVDTEGLVQKFQKRQATANKLKENRKTKKETEKQVQKEREEQPRSLKEMLAYAKKHPTL